MLKSASPGIVVSVYTVNSRGGSRTRTGVTPHWILSPERLPFRHSANSNLECGMRSAEY